MGKGNQESKDLLKEFISQIIVNDNTLAAIENAFDEIGKKYRIGKLYSVFDVADNIYTAGGEHQENVMYCQPCGAEDEPDYVAEFRTGENGTVKFYVYRCLGTPAYTEEEKQDIEVIMQLIYLHCGRWRMISRNKKVGLSDSLTGLPNAGGFLTYVDELLKKDELVNYNAYYFNLVRFGLINRRFGVKETDNIIKRYSEVLKKFLVKEECVGRLGGDNFVALIRKERTEAFLNFLAGAQTEGFLGTNRQEITISAVAGILEIDASVKNCGEILNDCAMALQIARNVAKKPYVFVSDEIKQKSYKEKQLASSFAEAMEKNEFLVYFQPKVRIDNYRMIGAEALVRWSHNGKLISPGEFIPVFERNGMICPLDFYMLEQVCISIRSWLARGIEPVRVSVNFSRKHLTNPNLADDIMRILNKYKTESKYIEIELTETVDESEAGLLAAFMKNMKQYHVTMSIDDFGTGYSSLNMLRTFPVDVLKIDRSFIVDLEQNSKTVLSNIIRMAGELHMDVVAEGVETFEQMNYLKSIECKVVQGFLFDRPMPLESFEKKLLTKQYVVG
ncbi:MAG: putative bifunctional diguanylate cyclase/phosphodiesterase [Suilimivivens sp.]